MNELLTRASEVQEATGISGPALIFLIFLALAVVLGIAHLYRSKRRNRRGRP